MPISIKPAVTMEEVALCRELAAQVWGEQSACSIPQMSVHAKYGGVLLLAFDDVTPVGFLFSFPALYQGEWVLWSHETAVLPRYLHQGIGAELKRTQRRQATSIGYNKIAWTFDPLVSRNAYFNLNKLGARVSEYKINAYGMDDTDNINRGMETDRFIAIWDAENHEKVPTSTDMKLKSEAELKSTSETPSKVDYEWLTFDENATPVLSPGSATFANPLYSTDAAVTIGTAVPLDFESLIGQNRNLAIAWRLAFRESATELMRIGFQPSHLVVEKYGEPEKFRGLEQFRGPERFGEPSEAREAGKTEAAQKPFAKYIWTRAGDQK